MVRHFPARSTRADTLRVVEVLRVLAAERKIWLWSATDLVPKQQIAADLFGFDHERHGETQLDAVATSSADGRKRMDLVNRPSPSSNPETLIGDGTRPAIELVR